MEAGREMESGDLPRDQDSEDLVQALLLEQDAAMDAVSKMPPAELSEALPKSVPPSQEVGGPGPVIRLAKSPSVMQVVKPVMSSWKGPSSVKEAESTCGSIKILSPVGPYSSSSSSSISSSRGPQSVKIIKGNETRQISLAQATEMGLIISTSPSSTSLSSPIKTTSSSVFIKSPIKLSSSSSPVTSAKMIPKAIVIGSQNSSTKQVIFQPGSDSQRIIRLPPTPISTAASSNIIQLNNSKVQYVKVALPAGATSGGSGEPLKIALPPKNVQQRKILPAARRVILPTASEQPSPPVSQGAGVASRYLPIAPLVEMKEQEESSNLVMETTPSLPPSVTSNTTIEVSSGVRLRKPCNCSKSQCLKLYCDCFANGEFCYNCNCFNCFNNLEHEEDRQRSIRSCLERNPNAFRPKIGRGAHNEGERVHHKGCNCKRSSCLKNYCECYEAKIPCTIACRCVACKNVEEFNPMSGNSLVAPSGMTSMCGGENNNTGNSSGTAGNHFLEHPQNNGAGSVTILEDSLPTLLEDTMENHQNILPLLKKEIKPSLKSRLTPFITSSNESSKSDKKSFSCVTNDVISATCQCLLTQAEEAEKSNLPESEIEALIIEEFGRCLKQIIDISKRNKS